MGLGHVRRQIAIAAALGAAHSSAEVLLATSVDNVAGLGLPPNVDTLKLPGLRKVANGDYSARRLGLSKTQLRQFRSAVLHSAVEAFKPDVVLVDKHPFGAKGELTSALLAAKARGARLVLGLRDVLDDPETVAKEWAKERIYERLPKYFDLVLVYGDPRVFDPLRHCPLPAVMAERIKYCGYVVGPAGCTACENKCPHLCSLELLSHPTVFCTVGGGEDGFLVLKTFLAASRNAHWKGVAVGGPLLSERELAILRPPAKEAGVDLHSYLPCLSSLFGRVDALVCMGGYNTLVEAISRGVPTVCVPRTEPRSEQMIRAAAFAKFDLLRMILPKEVTAENLAQAIAQALKELQSELATRANRNLKFNGAQIAAQFLLKLRKPRPCWLPAPKLQQLVSVAKQVSLARPA